VVAAGDPNTAGKNAFGLLFKAYFKTRGAPKGPNQSPPRARWPEDLSIPKDQWVGRYAMVVPQGVTELPQVDAPEGVTVSLTTWEYGEVAEILHIGPYDKEQPTMEKLKAFVAEQGYETFGPHEEEYLKGPTMFSAGDPAKYCTILRYRVRKAAPEEPPSEE